jgi:polyisoprenoid-binding protein YceI
MTTTAIPAELTGDYTVDASHSHFGFVARHAMITKVKGAFREFTGGGHFDAADPGRSTLELTIAVDSIDTGNADRDAHLRTNDFFDLEHFPEIRFVSTAIEPSGQDVFSVTGDLTIKGVTKPVTIEVEYTGAAEDPFGNNRIGLEGSLTVNRKDWGLDWNVPLGAGGVLVSEKVTLEFDVSAVKNEPA